MDATNSVSILEHFAIVIDPRLDRNKEHLLIDIITITICAVICGADTWVDIADFGNAKESWLKKFLTLPNGIPSHDTFRRVFSILDPDEFQQGFLSWVKEISKLTKGSVVAIDGKSVRRAHSKNQKPIHIISAFAVENGVTLGQMQVDGKTNEITAIPELLKLLELKGCIVTIDAMGTQGWIVKKIREQSADYALAVKANQKKLLQDIQKTIDDEANASALDYYRTSERTHGREEIRECWSTDDLSLVRNKEKWIDLRSIARIVHTRTINGKTTTETRHYITSLEKKSEKLLKAVRDHWAIENTLHWTLDVAFREDESRAFVGHSQENLALVRKLSAGLLKQEHTKKMGIAAKRKTAGWSEEYLEKVLGLKILAI